MKSNKNDNNLEIDCPHCYEKNKINLSSEIKCKHCDKPLVGEKYTKPIMSALTAILLGLGGGFYLDDKFEADRYPISIEYDLINSCVSFYEKPLKEKDYRKKQNVCICTLKYTQEEIDYSEYKESENKFFDIFEEKVKECI